MARVYASSFIPAPASAVWSRIRDFNALPRWTPFVAESRIEQNLPSDKVGCIRNFSLKDGGRIREQLLGLAVDRIPVDESAALGHLPAEEEVLRDGQIRNEREFLMNDRDSLVLGILDGPELDFLTIEDDRALVVAVGVDTGQDLHQGRLACAVLPANCVDLTCTDIKVDVLEHLHPGEVLVDVTHLQDC